MATIFKETDLEYFTHNVWDSTMSGNNGGMGAPDMFSLWYILNLYKPKVVVESGVWNGMSTKLIRKTLPDAIIFCLDPRNVPSTGYIDKNDKTIYLTGSKFIDFGKLDLSKYNPDDIVCFFDCHQNAFMRVVQSIKKRITNVFLNDNYPVKCGSHFTIEHLINDDKRLYTVSDSSKKSIIDLFESYYVFPNIYPGKITTGEGDFDCQSYFKEDNDKFPIFKTERNKYRWNTFLKLKKL